ncbi:uncharacterized protein LOC106180139 [Lingula anatina]|uniref:Uncharacterized protein LOC106180139 n=1 Tax=Lingula anatina TaxID=7574 RepID=A0A1S3KAG5_LINAN|nr:uncharacterized protein LOC106180139 [Lingula anatina]|eukprot:XP_013419487.1 uncharacterized protein LOC106180139 [Lingula anatina]
MMTTMDYSVTIILCFLLCFGKVHCYDGRLEERDVQMAEKSNENHILKTVSQCFHVRGNPFVTLYCGSNHMIKINRAFHGMHHQNISRCNFLPGDCMDGDLSPYYDWSNCLGAEHCVKSVKQSWLRECGNYSKYLQIDYQCVKNEEVFDICEKSNTYVTEGYIKSPNYPSFYPIHRDCECNISVSGKSRMLVSFYDLLLEMNGKKCADWLMIYDDDYKDLNCGEIMTGMKNVSWQGPQIRLHFHTDVNNTRRQSFSYNTQRNLKGFWVYFNAEPKDEVLVKCGPTKPKKLQSYTPNPIPKGGVVIAGTASTLPRGWSFTLLLMMTVLY